MSQQHPPKNSGRSDLTASSAVADRLTITDRSNRGVSKDSAEGRGWDADSVEDEEFQEFLAADGLGAKADPVFKEELRRTLWRMVDERYGSAGDEPEEV